MGRRLARQAAGLVPHWIEQVAAFAEGTDHPGRAIVSVGYVVVVPPNAPPAPWVWIAASSPTDLPERQRKLVAAGVKHLQRRLATAPVAFRMLAKEFTLGELQRTYEALLGRRLHKASFRRALLSAWLVEPVDAWRSEGRGRPAQLFRFSPRRRKGAAALRFEMA